MSLLKSEPFAAVQSMEELLAIAYLMEQEAISGYSDLAERMRREGRHEMVPVFEGLANEESQHLENVVHWSERIIGSKPDLAKLKWEPTDTFDDEGASTIAPELLSAYRTFSMAVRNEERAFLFWTYVAAQTDEARLREAAEKMAREELGHLTTLRRERRHAFHAERGATAKNASPNLSELERKFAAHLAALAGRTESDLAPSLREAANGALARADALGRKPFAPSPLLRNGVTAEVSERIAPLCELLLDCYLDFGETLASEEERSRAQRYAADAVASRSLIRAAVTEVRN